MRMGVLCAASRARRMDAGLLHELLGQGDTIAWWKGTKMDQVRAALEAFHLLGW